MEYVVPADMRIEHVAFNVAEPVAMAHWYTEHLQMRVVRIFGPPWHAHFLVDADGESMIEIYYNSTAPVPPYGKMDPLVLHLAFAVDNVGATRTRLLQAGATTEGEATTSPTGDNLAMLRDPWGFAIQLVKRAVPMPGPQ
jgi:glyoxylase I family protein